VTVHSISLLDLTASRTISFHSRDRGDNLLRNHT
jgi:hypothetical protein